MANSAPDVGKIFGGVLRRYRNIAGMSQEELADRAEVDRTHISRLERGVQQPTIATLIGLAIALGVPAADLARETEAEFVGMAQRKRKLSDKR
jgi:transcriptional regulator with XRE-family HTH domain